MAKRATGLSSKKMGKSPRKTKKRLATKREMLASKKTAKRRK